MAGWHSSLPSRATNYDVLAVDWNNLIDNLNFLAEVAYTEFTATVTAAGTTVSTASQIVSAGAVTYQNAPHLIEFYCPRVNPSASGTTYLVLRDGTTILGAIGDFSAGGSSSPVYVARRLTPTAASHSYNIASWVVSGSASYNAGSGGSAGDSTARLPGFIRVTRIPT